MNPYKLLIVDDEEPARMLLTNYAEKMPELKLVGVCSSAMEAYSILKENTIDILVLDIQMPDLNGLELISMLGSNPPAIIVSTAYSEYAVESFELNVTDYLLKPIRFDRFFKAINKAISKKTIEKDQALLKPQADYIFIKTENKFIKLALDDIHYLASYGEYVKIHTANKTHVSLSSLADMEAKLKPSGFTRVHRSYLINMDKVEEVFGNIVKLCGVEIPISKRKKDEFMGLIRDRM